MEDKRRKASKDALDLFRPSSALENMDSLFDYLTKMPYRLLTEYIASPYKMPDADIIDNGDSYTIKIDVPGVDKKDIKLKVLDNNIVIKAEKSSEREEKNGGYYSKERASVGYYRNVALPEQIKPSSAKAKMDNGTLMIQVDKAESAVGKEIKVD